MPIRNAQLLKVPPVGLSDTRDSTGIFMGAAYTLQNLIHDTTTDGVMVIRPGVTSLTTFSGFTSPGDVSLAIRVGTRVYGLLTTTRFNGYDEPFCYDTAAQAFVTMGNVLSTNVPPNAPTSGAWTPPSAAVVGPRILITYPTAAAPNYFYWIDFSNQASPTWNAGNVATNPLSAPPSFVASYYNRAWYVLNNMAVFSDSLAPLTVTNASQALTLGEQTAIKAMAPQPLTTGTQGILSALLGFKDSSIWQITGDFALGNLALNELTGSVGCSAPRTIVPTPEGVFFMAVDGIRSVTLGGQVTEPQPDVVAPFQRATVPSRACAAYNSGIYRIALDTVLATGTAGKYDYWYSFTRKKWSGPHTFGYDAITPLGATFVLGSNASPATLWAANVLPTNSDNYTENGALMAVQWRSSVIPFAPNMAEKSLSEMSLLAAANGTGASLNITAFDESNTILGSTTFNMPAATSSLWGSSTWGAFDWAAPQYNLVSYLVSLPAPVAFKQLLLAINANAVSGLRFGPWSLRYQSLGYTGTG